MLNVAAKRKRRYSDINHHWGPFTYSPDSGYISSGIVLSSGYREEHQPYLRFSFKGHHLLIEMPKFLIKPWREWKKSYRDDGEMWYEDWNRQYGFSIADNYLHYYYGPSTHDSQTDHAGCKVFPWKDLRYIGTRYYDLEGNLWYFSPAFRGFDRNPLIEQTPTAKFNFLDYDGEELIATTRIEEWEWEHGSGWFSWLKYFKKNKIRRSLDIQFSGETGPRKGSWKGGTLGHSIDMKPGEDHAQAFHRYCLENNMKFLERIEE